MNIIGFRDAGASKNMEWTVQLIFEFNIIYYNVGNMVYVSQNPTENMGNMLYGNMGNMVKSYRK